MIQAPPIKLIVFNEYLTQGAEQGVIEAYLLGVDCRMSSFIRFTVLLESGAVWSGLPIEALGCTKFGPIDENADALSTEKLQPYSCLEGPVSIVSYELIKNAQLETKLGPAHYLFTINYQGEGLAEDPEQYKTHNIVVLQSGQLAALPNNFIRVIDNWFTNKDLDVSAYKRSHEHYFPGG